MKEVYRKIYDLPALLKWGDLDIRGIAAKNEKLSVDEYFKTLSKFLDDAPIVEDSLTKIITLAAREADFQNLSDTVDLLTNIGGDKIIPGISSVLEAGEKNNRQTAALQSLRIAADFRELYKRTMTAGKKVKVKVHNTGEKAMRDEDEEPSLKMVLEELDYEEANRKLRILAVDDTSMMLHTISLMLNDDYEIFSLTNGAQVKSFLRHTTPELFLLDYSMPGMNGFELMPVIRSFEEHKDTPVIFLTSMGTPYHVNSAASLGARDFIIKPVNEKILLEKIAVHIVRKKAF